MADTTTPVNTPTETTVAMRTKSAVKKNTAGAAGKTTKSAAAAGKKTVAAADIVKDCRVCWTFMADENGICREHGKRVMVCPPDTCAYSLPDTSSRHVGSPSYSPTSVSCSTADTDTQYGAYSPPHSPMSPLYNPTSPSCLPPNTP
jgi:hypothetical protein